MAGSLLTESLDRYTLKDEPGFDLPFLLTVGGTKWSVASDRKWVVAVKGGGPFQAPSWPDESHEVRLSYFTRVLGSEVPDGEGAIMVPVENVLSWAKQGCGEDQITVGAIQGVTVNIQRLAYILEGLPFKQIHVWDATETAGMLCLGMSAGGGRWKAFLAGFPLSEEDDPDVDAFDPNANPQQDAFRMAMEMGD